MRTPYVPHFFGEDAQERVRDRFDWLTAGVASSIPWPQEDVLVVYGDAEFLLRGALPDGNRQPPCISTPCPRGDREEALARLLRFVSVLGWFKRGYVDVSGLAWSTRPIRYGHPRDVFTTITQGGRHGFSCNHMPIIEDDQTRMALAFVREGRRLRHVHEAYSFLSFFKVLESQFNADRRKAWIARNLDALGGDAANRITELRNQGIDVNEHLYVSGRCAVAHASVGRDIVDPDVPADRRRIRDDLAIIEALATHYLAEEARVPDEMVLYRTRDRLAPWHELMSPDGLARLKAGGELQSAQDAGRLHGATASVRLWPNAPSENFLAMTLSALVGPPGCVRLRAINPRRTLGLNFMMDVAHGHLHALVEECGTSEAVNILTEDEVATMAGYFHRVVGNGLVEISIDGVEPVECDVIIPTNIIPRIPEEAVAEAVAEFRRQRRAPPDPVPTTA